MTPLQWVELAFNVLIGILGILPHKPAPRPLVTATNTPAGLLITASCPAPYVVGYPAGSPVPTTEAEQINRMARAVCVKKPAK